MPAVPIEQALGGEPARGRGHVRRGCSSADPCQPGGRRVALEVGGHHHDALLDEVGVAARRRCSKASWKIRSPTSTASTAHARRQVRSRRGPASTAYVAAGRRDLARCARARSGARAGWCGRAGRSPRTTRRRSVDRHEGQHRRCAPAIATREHLERGEVLGDLRVHLVHVALERARGGRPPCRRSTGRARRPGAPAASAMSRVVSASTPRSTTSRAAASRRSSTRRRLRSCRGTRRRGGLVRSAVPQTWRECRSRNANLTHIQFTVTEVPMTWSSVPDLPPSRCSAAPPLGGLALGTGAAATTRSPAGSRQGPLPDAGRRGRRRRRHLRPGRRPRGRPRGPLVLVARGPRPGRRPGAQPPPRRTRHGARSSSPAAPSSARPRTTSSRWPSELKVPTFLEYNTGKQRLRLLDDRPAWSTPARSRRTRRSSPTPPCC